MRAEAEQLEKITTRVFRSAAEATAEAATKIATLVRDRHKEGRTAVLGLATGSTPVRLYRELIRLHREDSLSFRNVVTFNLDEYYGLGPSHPESYNYFMRVQLFDHIDIPPAQVHIPNGQIERSRVFAYCEEYEKAIAQAGGIDFQLLGIGRTGHIGFNEPGSSAESRTRLVSLDRLTRRDAARDFRGEANVPLYAITMGIGTILAARSILLLAWGDSKAAVLRAAIEEPATGSVPASALQAHSQVEIYVDQAAASELTRFQLPWKVGQPIWDKELIRRAVVWLAEVKEKPVLRLRDEDYSENALADLLIEAGSAYMLNLRVFNELQHTITGWPGGKPGADDSSRPVPADPPDKRVLVLSPEPLDAELAMGGTLHRLVSQNHVVSLVYLTSGNLSVPDDEARLALSLLNEIPTARNPLQAELDLLATEIVGKAPFDEDSSGLRRFKGQIRRAEARASARLLGLKLEQVRFLELPFYEHGRYRQFEVTPADTAEIARLCREIQPDQIYLTGAGADPNSVAGIAYQLVVSALATCQSEPWYAQGQIWSYSSNEQPWPVDKIEMAVPLSPAELAVKLDCLYHHRSQRSQTPLPRGATGEVWELAEQANRTTARAYDRLGLAEYEAIESFKLQKQSSRKAE